ncbi:MAG: hypothetical protein KAJ19_22045 [Gammaproteobacteria bacterium]|nr:hypothetical protein [Gammaproteobacteria bacterium]
MNFKMNYKEGQPIKRTEVHQIMDDYLNKLEATWKEAGLPCTGFKEKVNREMLLKELIEEVENVYPLIDC